MTINFNCSSVRVVSVHDIWPNTVNSVGVNLSKIVDDGSLVNLLRIAVKNVDEFDFEMLECEYFFEHNEFSLKCSPSDFLKFMKVYLLQVKNIFKHSHETHSSESVRNTMHFVLVHSLGYHKHFTINPAAAHRFYSNLYEIGSDIVNYN